MFYDFNVFKMAFRIFEHYLVLSSFLAFSFAAPPDTIGFDNTFMTVPESIGQVTFCISFTEGEDLVSTGKGTVFTTNPDRDAPAGSVGNVSYYFQDVTINRPSCFNATVLDNKIVESGKVYYLNITTDVPNLFYAENKRTLKIIITDDDRVSIGFSKTSLAVSESDGYASVCMNRVGEARNLGGGQVPQGALSVRLSTAQGTAKSDEDFTLLDSTLVNFRFNEMFKCINVTIKNDEVIENMETFYVTMTNGSSLVIVNETRNNLTVHIRGRVTAQFEEAYNKKVEENFEEGKIELSCVINHASTIPLQIGFDIDNFTSTAIVGSDFTIENKSLTFLPGKTNVTLKINIIRDGVAESPEILVLRMVSLDDNLVIIGKNDTAKVKINDKVDNENEAARQKIIEKERSRRREVYILLIVAIVLIAFLFICGIVFCVCFIKSKDN